MAKKYKKRRRKKPVGRHYRINFATIVSLSIFAYLLVHIIMSASKPKVSTYEVTAQKIYDKISTTAMAVRSEELVTTSQAGYVTYYVADGERVGVRSSIYAIDGSGSVVSQLSNQDGSIELTDDNYLDLKNQIMDYKSTYDDASFASIYDFKYALDNNILEITNDSLVKKVDELVASGKASSLDKVASGKTGVISYSYDGLESTTLDTIRPSLFENKENRMKQIRSSEMYEKGAPVYRLVTSENWDLVVPLTKEQYDMIKSEEYLTVKFKKDDLKITRGATFNSYNGFYYVSLSFNKYMEQYMGDRFLDVDIVLNSVSGLKIPNTSLLKEELYAIPVEYVVESDETVSGVAFNQVTYKKNGTEKAQIITPGICYYDKKEECYYVSGIDVSPGDVLVKTVDEDNASDALSHGDRYTISQKREFEGVFTINKGYAQFVVINNLYQADDFCISENNMEHGISQYDHVVLDSKSIQEGQIIY